MVLLIRRVRGEALSVEGEKELVMTMTMMEGLNVHQNYCVTTLKDCYTVDICKKIACLSHPLIHTIDPGQLNKVLYCVHTEN